MSEPRVTHNTRLDINVLDFEATGGPIQAYAKDGAVCIDFNGQEFDRMMTLSPAGASDLIAIIRASLADLEVAV